MLAKRFFYVSLGTIALACISPRAAEADAATVTQAYFDGELISVKIKPIPEGAAASLVSHNASVEEFFDGARWLCVGNGNVWACFLDRVAPVLKSIPQNLLLRARQIFWMPGRTPRDLTSWNQIEEAVASGDILLTEERGIYRATILRDHDSESVAGKSAAETGTWGQVKSLFR